VLSNRTFGVEIECGHDTFNVDTIDAELVTHGFNVGYGYDYKDYTIDIDGSGLEIKTPVLKGKKGYKEVFRIMDFLTSIGCWVSRKDGMHVHIGAKQFYRDEKACAALARTWYNNQAIIGRMCSSHRTGNTHCPRIASSEVDKLGQTVQVDSYYDYYERKQIRERVKDWGNRKSLNFVNLEDGEKPTIEFRLHEGCLDPAKAVAWIKFCQKLIDYTARERIAIPCARSKTALLTTLSVPLDASAILSRKQPLMPAGTRPARR